MSKKRASLSDNSPLSDVGGLFKSTSPKKKQSKQDEPETEPTTIRFYKAHNAWLDDLIYKARKSGSGKAINKSALLRMFIEILQEGKFDLNGTESEAEIKDRILEFFNK